MKTFHLFAVLVTLLLLLGSVCNAELRTWTAVNGKEVKAEFVSNEKGIVKLKLKSGKVFEVPANKLSKEDNEFISSLAKPDGVNEDELERRENIIYLKGSDTPYTGKSSKFYENGKKEFEVTIKDGKEDGLVVKWHKNGQKKAEVNRLAGKPEGIHWEWYESGQKRGEINWKNGKKNGIQTQWHENGNKKSVLNFNEGKPDGLFLSWYENGQKLAELNFKEGKNVGIYVEWHENGQKAREGMVENEDSQKFWNSKGESVNSFEETGLK